MARLEVGNKIPSFCAKDQDGIEVASEDLLGQPFVIYFYPKDDTPGCTKQACAFRDHMPYFDDLGVLLLGISPDNAASHHNFSKKHELNFSLLCDEDLTIARAFDVLDQTKQDKLGLIRATFLVDSSGIIQWIEKPVSVENHSERLLQVLNKGLR